MDVTHKDKDVSLSEVGEQHQGEDDGKSNCDSHLSESSFQLRRSGIKIVNNFHLGEILCLDHLGVYRPPGSLGGQRRAFRPGFRSRRGRLLPPAEPAHSFTPQSILSPGGKYFLISLSPSQLSVKSLTRISR